MSRKKKEDAVVVRNATYYFCPEGHMTRTLVFGELEGKETECHFCEKVYDNDKYECVIADTEEAAKKIFNEDDNEIEVVKTEKLEEAMWYRFCGEGHCFDIRKVITDDDPRYCKACKKEVDIYEEEAIRAASLEEAKKQLNDPDGTTPSSASPNPPLLKTGGEPLVFHPGYMPGGSEIIQYIGIDQLKESSSNPRRHYDEKGLNDLAESIKAKGVVQNLVVCALPDSTTRDLSNSGEFPRRSGAQEYVIVAGSRRFRAAKIAGLKALPCVVRNYTDAEILEIQVIENNQREDVHPLEEGEGYAALLKIEGYTVEAIAGKIGRSDKYVRERLQLAKLSPKAKDLYQKDILKYTHCRILSRLTIEQQEEAIQEIVREDYLTSGKHSLAVKSLEFWVEFHVEKKLGSATFPLDDKTLNKEMGPCIGCIKNTASDMQLFPEYAEKASKGVCLNPVCFNIKVRAYAERLVKEKANDEKLKDVLLVSETSWRNNEKKIGKAERLVIGYENWERVKKGEKGAQKAIIVGTRDIEDKGKTIWVKLRNKKDAKPSKSDKQRSRSQYSEPEMTPEQKAEKERLEKYKETQHWFVAKKYFELGLIQQTKKTDKSILKKALIQAINEAIPYQWNGMVAGLTVEEWYKTPWDKRRKALDEFLIKKSVDELIVMCVVAYAFDPGDMKKACENIGIELKNCIEAGDKAAEEQYPDPAKQLIVSFAGLKYGLKESDFMNELRFISEKIRFANKKEGSEYKELNVPNPGGNNMMFRKDAKSGQYRFSTWIDADGTAMGFDMLPEAKFKKMLKGFAEAVSKGKTAGAVRGKKKKK